MDADELARFVLEQIEGPYLGVMIYGSQVRGDFTDTSDFDVLQLNAEAGPNYSKGLVVVSVRTPEQLEVQCVDGDMYALSLTREGRILADPDGVLARTLATYREPTDNYARKWYEFQTRTRELDAAAPVAFEEHRISFVRAMLYLLRNACMVAHIRKFGEPCFSLPELARALDLPELPEIFRGRTDEDSLTRERMDRARTLLERVFRTMGPSSTPTPVAAARVTG